MTLFKYSRQHYSRDSGDFFANRLFEFFNGPRTTFKELSFDAFSWEKGTKSAGYRVRYSKSRIVFPSKIRLKAVLYGCSNCDDVFVCAALSWFSRNCTSRRS